MDNQLYIDRLEKKEVKPTAMRILILRTMMTTPYAVSLANLESILDTVDKSTIFRTLTIFLKHHLVHGIEDGSGSMKYEVCSNECTCSIEDMHTHFYCEKCHHTFCFKTIHIPVVNLPAGFVVRGANYIIKGICSDCASSSTLS